MKYDEIKCDIGRENSHFSNDLAQIDFPRRPNWEGETEAVKIDIIERKRFSEYIEKVHSDHKGKGNGIMTGIISEIFCTIHTVDSIVYKLYNLYTSYTLRHLKII